MDTAAFDAIAGRMMGMLKDKKTLLTGIVIDLIVMLIVCIFNVVIKNMSYLTTTDHIESINLYSAYIIGHMYAFFFMVIVTVIFNILQYNHYKKVQSKRTSSTDKKYLLNNILISFIVFMIWVVIFGIIVFF